MPGEIFDFIWFVNRDGYSIVNDGGKQGSQWLSAVGEAGSDLPEGKLIVANVKAGGGYHLRQYNPLRQHKCLFRVFAETGDSDENVVDFAGCYGLLGLDLEHISPGGAPLPKNMEPLSSWRLEIGAMRKALTIWDMVQDEDARGLESYLGPLMRWVAADQDPYHGDVSGAGISTMPQDPAELRWFRLHPEFLEIYRSGDLETPAMLGVQFLVNQHLERRIAPRILWDDSRRQGWSLYFVPVNLAGALWLQLSQSITQQKDYRRCRQCGSWFEIDHYTARTNRYFCSNACRSKAYRDRQAKARQLSREGMPMGEIADELGSERDTVARWVSRDTEKDKTGKR